MSQTYTVVIPDLGDFDQVPVIELLVQPGDTVEAEQSLMTLESDKATMEIPSPKAGVVAKLLVGIGDEVTAGTAIAELSLAQPEQAAPAPSPTLSETTLPATAAAADEYDADLVVLGSGPGGYAAAFRAADLGLSTVLIERYPRLGGVCLNVGCIPSKAFLHTAEVIDAAEQMAAHGVEFGPPKIDVAQLRGFKDKVVGQLTGGIAGLAKQRKVTVIHGNGQFVGPHEIAISTESEVKNLRFAKAIIAAGSQSIKLPGMPWDDERLMDSTDALELPEVPKRLLVIGGGIIGMEMACVFDALGSQVTVCELLDQLMPGADPDLVRPFHKRVKARYENIFLQTKVAKIEATKNGLVAHFEGQGAPATDTFDRVLVAVGRAPNGLTIGAEQAGVAVTERGFIEVDHQMRTNVPHIFAIGDIVGQPMLAHKATHEGKVAAEVCAGERSAFDARVIPSVAYTDPEIAWVGLTEQQAKEQGLDYGVGKFPWAASGRALGIGRSEGFTKLLFDRKTERIIGAGIIGPHAGDLIAECGLAIEMGSVAADIGLTIHPHPTLSETVGMAAEAFEGTITDLYMPKRK